LQKKDSFCTLLWFDQETSESHELFVKGALAYNIPLVALKAQACKQVFFK